MVELFGKGNPQPADSLVGSMQDVAQQVVLESAVMEHVLRHRQLRPWSKEAGGQLFGSISPDFIQVVRATGPYSGDERSRYRYRSNPNAAQRAIEECSAQQLLYLGEWHTHAEDRPSASGLDGGAMKLLMANSRLNSNSLLMLIAGRAEPVDGIGLWTVTAQAARLWQLRSQTSR